MPRSSLNKLVIVMLVVFILCLPDFFPPHQAKVKDEFSCISFGPCLNKRESDARCFPPSMWVESMEGDLCAGVGNKTDPQNLGVTWFLCKTDTEPSFHRSSMLAEGHSERSLVIQSQDTEGYNVTFMMVGNHSLIHAPEDQRVLFSCAAESTPNAGTYHQVSNHSCCILRLWGMNSTTLKTTLLWALSVRGFWSCTYRMVWLLLVLIVVLLVLNAVTWEVFKDRRSSQRTAVPPILVDNPDDFLQRHPNEETGLHAESVYNSRFTDLSTIREEDETGSLHPSDNTDSTANGSKHS
ncbi:hypothetical protein GN956_G12290 [Arapaima gigas]